jgi:hypothetical protein
MQSITARASQKAMMTANKIMARLDSRATTTKKNQQHQSAVDTSKARPSDSAALLGCRRRRSTATSTRDAQMSPESGAKFYVARPLRSLIVRPTVSLHSPVAQIN